MIKDPITETETHHNQALTIGAAQKKREQAQVKPSKKIVAIQLTDREHAAYRFLGGMSGLKKLLCPEGLCIRCRTNPSEPGSKWDSFCQNCDDENQIKN